MGRKDETACRSLKKGERHIEGFGGFRGYGKGLLLPFWHLKGGEVGFGGLNFDGGEASKVWEIKVKVFFLRL